MWYKDRKHYLSWKHAAVIKILFSVQFLHRRAAVCLKSQESSVLFKPNYFPDHVLLVHSHSCVRYRGSVCYAPCSSHPLVPQKRGPFGRDVCFGPISVCSQAVNLGDHIAQRCCKWILPQTQPTHDVHMTVVSAMVLLCWLRPARLM